MLHSHVDEDLEHAAELLAGADSLVIGAGAGIGVDSGLPDFRGRDGFWRAYPALRRAQMDFTDIANPAAFHRDPRLAWGFYGHRLDLYRRTVPHVGFEILLALSACVPRGAFVYTSNVDGQFQRAGFRADQIVEAHGSIHHLQCLTPCSSKTWPATAFVPEVNVERCELLNAAPRCPDCGAVARPNILMFGDWHWVSDDADAEQTRFDNWWRGARRAVVIELGAGKAVPTVRRLSEALGVPLIRINPDAPEIGSRPGLSLPMRAREALERIAVLLSAKLPEFSAQPAAAMD